MNASPAPSASVSDPRWFAHRYDPVGDAFHLIPVDRAARAAAVFLTDERLGNAVAHPVAVPRTQARRGVTGATPHRYILHSAFCCSTLLANALEQPGLAHALREPVLLNDLVGWRRRGAAPGALAAVLGDALAILGACPDPGEALVVKPSNVTNALAPAMLALRPEARALWLYAPLPVFLASVASKGMWGRLWVRELYAKLAADGACGFGFDDAETPRQTDLQIAALGWLAQHRLYAGIAARWPVRVAALDSETLLADPAAALAAVGRLFALPLDAAAIAAGPVFGRNAKTGDAFGRAARAAVHAPAEAAHREEIDKVVAWIDAVAAANAIPLAAPRPLLPG